MYLKYSLRPLKKMGAVAAFQNKVLAAKSAVMPLGYKWMINNSRLLVLLSELLLLNGPCSKAAII